MSNTFTHVINIITFTRIFSGILVLSFNTLNKNPKPLLIQSPISVSWIPDWHSEFLLPFAALRRISSHTGNPVVLLTEETVTSTSYNSLRMFKEVFLSDCQALKQHFSPEVLLNFPHSSSTASWQLPDGAACWHSSRLCVKAVRWVSGRLSLPAALKQ